MAKGACRLAVLLRGDAGPADRRRGRGEGVDAGQEHVLPPQAALGSRDPPAGRLTRRDEPPAAPVLRPRGPGASSACPTSERAAEARGVGAGARHPPGRRGPRRAALLLVDVQNTFCLPEFELFVAGRSGSGAVDDYARIAPSSTATSAASPRSSRPSTPTPPRRSSIRSSGWTSEGATRRPHTVIRSRRGERALARQPGAGRRPLRRGRASTSRPRAATTCAGSRRAASTRSSSGPTTRCWAESATRSSRQWKRPSSSTRSPAVARRASRPRARTPSPRTTRCSRPEVRRTRRAAPSLGQPARSSTTCWASTWSSWRARPRATAWPGLSPTCSREIRAATRALAAELVLLDDCSSPVVVPGSSTSPTPAEAAYARFAAAGMRRALSTDALAPRGAPSVPGDEGSAGRRR